MSSITLKKLSLTIFGESHGPCIGGVITGLPAGHKLDFEKIDMDVLRRKPGKDDLSTPRNELDKYEIVSGIKDGILTGAPLCVIIKNSDTHSSDYSRMENIPRPSHSDYTAYIKYNGFNDVRGGGHFSGRLTAPLTVIGSICKQLLEKEDIKVVSHLLKVKNITDKSLLECNEEEIDKLMNGGNSVEDISEEFYKLITDAKANKDSLGAVTECGIINMKAGLGGPLFDGLEGKLATLLYGIPGVKGVEFGIGFDFSQMSGSQANDGYTIKDGKVRTLTNNNGGILGGISNGENIIFRVAFKPTPSIALPQKSVNLKTGCEEILEIKGRHDPIIALRALPVIEGITAIGILDEIL